MYAHGSEASSSHGLPDLRVVFLGRPFLKHEGERVKLHISGELVLFMVFFRYDGRGYSAESGI